MSATAADAAERGKAVRPPHLVWIIAAVAAAAVIGFVAGSQRSRVDILSGAARVGDHVASIRSGDSYYGVRESVAWFDASGTFHEDGWPDCLTSGRQVDVRFGVVPVTAPESGLTFNKVTYIDCRGA